jgi:pimeloyl-ACP methyl ester carboxylesterase
MGIQPPTGEYLDQMMTQHSTYVREGFTRMEAFEALFGAGDAPEHIALWESARETIARVAWKPYMYSLQLPHHLRNVMVPTRVITGEQDKIVPLSCCNAYAELMPNASLVTIADGGHWLDIESPSSVVEAIMSFAR